MNLFSQEFSEIGNSPNLGGLGAVTDADLVKYFGLPRSMMTDEEYAINAAIAEAAKQSDAAQAKADAAYDAIVAARNAAYPAAYAALVFDSTGRATETSIRNANDIQTQAAATQTAAYNAAEIAAQAAAAREIAVVNQVTAQAAAVSLPVVTQIQTITYTDAQIATAAHDMYMSGLQPSQVIVNLKRQFNISNERAMAIANSEFNKAYPGTGAQTSIQPGSGVTVLKKELTVGDVLNSYMQNVSTKKITRLQFINQMRSQGVSDTVLTQAFAEIDKQMPIVEPPFVNQNPTAPMQSSNTGTLILAALAAYLIGS